MAVINFCAYISNDLVAFPLPEIHQSKLDIFFLNYLYFVSTKDTIQEIPEFF